MNDKSPSLRNDLKKDGYSKEEKYFQELDRELIQKRRKELDKKRRETEEAQAKTLHWMRCPKCGSQMAEVNLSGICADQCGHCLGIYFDRGEFETLLEARVPKSIVRILLDRLRKKISSFDTEWRP